MALPELRVEVAWTSTFSDPIADRVYTDVTPDVRRKDDLRITRGRADEQGQVTPDQLSLVLENNEGQYTVDNPAGENYPNVKLWRPIRVRYRYSSSGSGNMLSANQASMETSIADWSAGGSAPPTLSQSTTHADAGTKALLITWATGGTFPLAQTTATGLVIGRTYTFQARVYVPTGSPDVLLAVAGIGVGTQTSTKNSFATVSYTFVATAGSHLLQVWPATSPTSGQQVWVDKAMLDDGSSVGTWTTTAPDIKDRFTGYIDGLPLEWPEGSDNYCVVRLSASSRRARLQKTSKLTSALREAILATEPVGYWPMTEGTDAVNPTSPVQQQIFRDITNPTELVRNNQLIASWYESAAEKPLVHDGSQGPTDEESLVYIKRTTDYTDPDWHKYIGSGNAFKIGTDTPTGDWTLELLARVAPFQPQAGANVDVVLAKVFIPDSFSQEVRVFVYDNTNTSSSGGKFVGLTLHLFDDTGAVIEEPSWFYVGTSSEEHYNLATDGEFHAYTVRVAEGAGGIPGIASLYLDGEWIAYTFFSVANTFTKRFEQIAMGPRTLYGDLWVGHLAAWDRIITTDELDSITSAALAASESLEDRVVRLAGRVGIDPSEVTVETSWAQELGPQPEAGNTVGTLLDDLALSTQGIVLDGRDGQLTMQARNGRYNPTAAFTLDAAEEQVEADLNTTADDQNLVNIIEVSRQLTDGSVTLSDDTSVEDYGDYGDTLSIITTSDQEVISAGYDVLYRKANPTVRFNKVSVNLGELTSSSLRDDILDADVSTLFSIINLPDQLPASTADQFLEGYTETLNDSVHTIEINTSRGDVYTNVWVPDVNDTLDSGIVVGH